MPKIKVHTRGYTFNKSKVNEFVKRIERVINELQFFDIDVSELIECKENIIKHKCYGYKDIWYIETMEDASQKYTRTEQDFLY